jgi:biotin carboxyl carrier protein
MELHLQEKGRRHRVRLQPEGEALRLEVEDGESLLCAIEAQDENAILLRVGDDLVRARYARNGHHLWIQVGARVTSFKLLDEEDEEDVDSAQGSPVVRAPMPGKVLALLVEEGQEVEVGQAVVRVEAMKMEVELPATIAGTVETIHAQAEELVLPDAPLVTIAPHEEAH